MKLNPLRSMDVVLLFSVFALVGLGLVMVYSASSALALERNGDSLFYLKRQMISACLGFLGLLVLSQVPYRWFGTMVYPILFGSLAIMVLVCIPGVGHEVGGARRWLHMGGFSFQPSELGKIGLAVYLAYSLSKKGEKVRDFSIGFVPHFLVLGLMLMPVLLQKDLGAAVLMTVLTITMLFVAGARLLHLAGAGAAGACMLAVAIILEPYRLERLKAFLNPWADPHNSGFQIIHSFMAFGSGGVLGAGFGEGKQKLFYLPEPHTDFILSVLGEEGGLVGVTAVLILYFIFFRRGIRVAQGTSESFGSLLAFGLTTLMGLQVIMNVWVVMGLIPTKGLALPFMSYGGSAMMMNLCAVGILLNVRSAWVQSQ
jgi:cell division protein FtsW